MCCGVAKAISPRAGALATPAVGCSSGGLLPHLQTSVLVGQEALVTAKAWAGSQWKKSGADGWKDTVERQRKKVWRRR